MDETPAGFKEIAHTADWQLDAWAPDLPGLLEQAARGMYALAGVRLDPGPPQARHLALKAEDAESLLVAFLSELLYYGEQEGLAFDRFSLRVEGSRLEADIEGRPIAALEKEIKAVTYHNLNIRQSPRGLEVSIVFDV
jgi:SHS2 domain-containing protein